MKRRCKGDDGLSENMRLQEVSPSTITYDKYTRKKWQKRL